MRFPFQFSLAYAIALLLSFVASSAVAQNGLIYSRVRVETSSIPGGLGHLLELGLAVDHGQVDPGVSITTDLSSDELAILTDHGYPYAVVIADVAEHYRNQNHDGAPNEMRDGGNGCTEGWDVPVPTHFVHGSMGGYYTWDEMIATLDEMAAEYPSLISVKQSIGESWEGRPLYFVRISNDPNVDQDKPEVLYDALHHAREPASLSQLIFFMWHLLENYGTDAELTYLLDNMELYFVPCVNPDGYVYNGTDSPDGGGMWRKNRRDNGDGSFGVDLNRNYGHEWAYDNSGSSGSTTSEVYRGPEAFSEPEIQAMRDFCNDHEFRLALNYHTYGNLLIYPWGYIDSFYTPDSAAFTEYGQLLTRENGYLHGTADQTVNYTTNGDSDDWMYGEQESKPKIFSLTPEAGVGTEGFWPPEWRIDAICKENIRQNLRLAHLAGRYALTTDRSSPVISEISTHVPFEIERYGQEPGPFTVGIEPLEHVVSAGTAVVFDNMDLLEVRLDSISLELDPFIQNGDVVRFALVVDNGLYAFRDTLSKTFGIPAVALADAGDDMGNWEPASWGTTTDTWYSPPSSITDSPLGDYTNNASNALTLAEPIDLNFCLSATLTFWAKWDIEPDYDQVQVSASSDGVAWTPLCGLYTKAGTAYQSEGEPVFEGLQLAWVQEQMDLAAFVGGPLHLRFKLISDGGVRADGFHFDDLQVITVLNGPADIPEASIDHLHFQCFPNPSSDVVRVTYDLAASAKQNTLVLYSTVGSVVAQVPIAQRAGEVVFPLMDLESGVYFFTLVSDGRRAPLQRLVVLHP